jgi:hypothetical protein
VRITGRKAALVMDQINRRPLRLRPVAEYLLYSIYDETMRNDEKSRFSISEISEISSRKIPRNLLVNALDLLRDSDGAGIRLLARHGTKENYEFSITRDGILNIERAINRRNSIPAYLLEEPNADINDIAGFDGLFYNSDEREDINGWAPLPIDRDTEDYRSTIETLESSLEVICGDNGFAEEFPEQRKGILEAMREDLGWLKEKTPSANVLKRLIIDPMKWIATKFGDSLLGNAGKIAAEKLIKYLFSLI